MELSNKEDSFKEGSENSKNKRQNKKTSVDTFSKEMGTNKESETLKVSEDIVEELSDCVIFESNSVT